MVFYLFLVLSIFFRCFGLHKTTKERDGWLVDGGKNNHRNVFFPTKKFVKYAMIK